MARNFQFVLIRHNQSLAQRRSAISELRKILKRERVSSWGLTHGVANQSAALTLVSVPITGIPEMNDYVCWDVELQNELHQQRDPMANLGQITAYDWGDSWSIQFYPQGFFEPLFWEFANAILLEMKTGLPTKLPRYSSEVLIENDLVLIARHALDEDALRLQFQVTSGASIGEIAQAFIDYNASRRVAESNFTGYYSFRIGVGDESGPDWSHLESPLLREQEGLWSLYYQDRYDQFSFRRGGHLRIELRPDGKTQLTLECSGYRERDIIFSQIAQLILFLQERRLLAFGRWNNSEVDSIPEHKTVRIKCNVDRLHKKIDEFAQGKLGGHGWGKSNLRLSAQRMNPDSPLLALWSVLHQPRNDAQTLPTRLGQIAAVQIAASELIAEFIPDAIALDAFWEFAFELLDAIEETGATVLELPPWQNQVKFTIEPLPIQASEPKVQNLEIATGFSVQPQQQNTIEVTKESVSSESPQNTEIKKPPREKTVPKPKNKRGKRSHYSQKKRDEIVKAWLSLDRDKSAMTLVDFLAKEVGHKAETFKLNLSPQGFYKWRTSFNQRHPNWKPRRDKVSRRRPGIK